MNLWNQKHLPAPPTFRYKSKTKDLDLVKFRSTIQDSIKHFKNEDFLIRETALLSRILYRMKMKFRNTKDFKVLEKINHSLNIYLNTNMVFDLNNILSLTPSKYQSETYLPTRNMLSYILVRIQGLVKLMERIYDTCQVAAKEITLKIAIGHFWKVYIILFSLVSRIHILVKFNTKFMCELYGKFLPYCHKLENTGKSWLPKGYDLPSDLREWLGVPWVYEEEYVDLTFEPSMKIMDFFDLVNDDEEDDEVQFCDEYVLIDEEDKSIANNFRNLKPVEETFTRNRMRGFSINEDDIGEEITDLITLDNTNYLPLEVIESDKEEYNSSDADEVLNVEDIGEQISDPENINIEAPKMLSSDETNCEINLFDNRNKEQFVANNNHKQSLKKKGNSDTEETNILDYPYEHDAQDIGEEIFDAENNNKNIPEIINLDETDHYSIKKIDKHVFGQSGDISISQDNIRQKIEPTHNKHNKFNTEISFDGHVEVVDISKNFEKTGTRYLNESDVIILNDTIPNTLVLNKLKTSVFETKKSTKKKRKKNIVKKNKDFENAMQTKISKPQSKQCNGKNKNILNNQTSSNVQLDNYIKETPRKQITQKTSNKRKNDDCDSGNNRFPKKKKKQNDPFNISQNYTPILQEKGNKSLVGEVLTTNKKKKRILKNKINKQNIKGNSNERQEFNISNNNVKLSQKSKRSFDTPINSKSKKNKTKPLTKPYDSTSENWNRMSFATPKNKTVNTRFKVTKQLDFNIEAVQVSPKMRTRNKNMKRRQQLKLKKTLDKTTPYAQKIIYDQNKINRNKNDLRIILKGNKDRRVVLKSDKQRLQSQPLVSPTIESRLEKSKARRSKRWHKKRKGIQDPRF